MHISYFINFVVLESGRACRSPARRRRRHAQGSQTSHLTISLLFFFWMLKCMYAVLFAQAASLESQLEKARVSMWFIILRCWLIFLTLWFSQARDDVVASTTAASLATQNVRWQCSSFIFFIFNVVATTITTSIFICCFFVSTNFIALSLGMLFVSGERAWIDRSLTAAESHCAWNMNISEDCL